MNELSFRNIKTNFPDLLKPSRCLIQVLLNISIVVMCWAAQLGVEQGAWSVTTGKRGERGHLRGADPLGFQLVLSFLLIHIFTKQLLNTHCESVAAYLGLG